MYTLIQTERVTTYIITMKGEATRLRKIEVAAKTDTRKASYLKKHNHIKKSFYLIS